LYYRQLSSKGGDASHNSNFFSVTHTTFLKKPNSSKTTEAISINFFLIETRIFSLQVFEEILLKFHLVKFLKQFKKSLKISLCYENFSQMEFQQKLFIDV